MDPAARAHAVEETVAPAYARAWGAGGESESELAGRLFEACPLFAQPSRSRSRASNGIAFDEGGNLWVTTNHLGPRGLVPVTAAGRISAIADQPQRLAQNHSPRSA
jgi:hypothetical protein